MALALASHPGWENARTCAAVRNREREPALQMRRNTERSHDRAGGHSSSASNEFRARIRPSRPRYCHDRLVLFRTCVEPRWPYKLITRLDGLVTVTVGWLLVFAFSGSAPKLAMTVFFTRRTEPISAAGCPVTRRSPRFIKVRYF